MIMFAMSDPDFCPGKEIKCIECTSEESHQYCKDPFIEKHALASGKLKTVPCKGFCTKLVMQKNDRIEYIRTCSSSIGIKMEKNLVCIRESRSAIGHLCFCNSDRCNSSRYIEQFTPTCFVVVLLSCILSFIF